MKGLDFTTERWHGVRETYRQWWEGTLDRPVIPVEFLGRDPGRVCPEVPLLSQATCSEVEFSAEQIIDRIDYELASRFYAGDAYPYFNMDCFGPGVVAAFLGAELVTDTGHVWFKTDPVCSDGIDSLHFEYDGDNRWLNRIKDLYKAGTDRWQGQVLMGMPDLGGICDILAVFMPGGELQVALYENPGEVTRLIGELSELWFRYYDELLPLLSPDGTVMTDWSSILNLRPGYIIQSDFSVMVSPGMFDEFILPELEETCRRLPGSIYHLDGPGEIRHVDSILSIRELDGVQWIPGAGAADIAEWPELLSAIRNAGKRIQVINQEFSIEAYERVFAQHEQGAGLHLRQQTLGVEGRMAVEEWLRRHGVPHAGG